MNIPFLYLAMSTSSICFEISSPTVSIRTELLGKYQRPGNHQRGLHSTGTDGQEILPFVAGIICPSRPLCRLNRIPQFVIKVLGPSLDAAVAFAALPGLALAFVLALAFALIAFGRLTSLSFMQWRLGSLDTGLGDMTLEGKGIDKALVMTARAKSTSKF